MTAEDFLKFIFEGDGGGYIAWSQHVVDGQWVPREPRSLVIDCSYQLNDEQVQWLEAFWAEMGFE